MLIEAYRAARKQIPTHVEITSDPPNGGLPDGAVRVRDPIVEEMLKRERVMEIQEYEVTRACRNRRFVLDTVSHLLSGAFKIGESDLKNPTFNNQIHPKVEGILWYRGFSFQNERLGGEVFLFLGWMQPWYEGGAPDYMVYTRGELNDLDVFAVVNTYCETSRALRENPPLDPREED